jgi:phosphatidate cytidylyltransferase
MAIGALVLGAAWLSLYELRIESPLMLVSAMALVWLADIGAYFFGRALGRHKLAPRVSPGKTWEGAVGGAAVVLIVAAVVALWWPSLATHVFSSHLISHLGWVAAACSLLLLTGLSIVGDLYESLLKRVAGVKDSGRTLPGHGGVLDRVDALLPTMPACLLLLQLLR